VALLSTRIALIHISNCDFLHNIEFVKWAGRPERISARLVRFLRNYSFAGRTRAA
jgi:hypothetical protein